MLLSMCAVLLRSVRVHIILVWRTDGGYYSIFVLSKPVAFVSVTLPCACSSVKSLYVTTWKPGFCLSEQTI